MLRRHPLVLAAVLLTAAAAVPAPAAAHVMAGSPSAAALTPGSVDGRTDPLTVGTSPPAFTFGPCTAASAAEQFQDFKGHDHRAIEQHEKSCAMPLNAFLPLKTELEDVEPGADDNEVLGEMDVKAGIAAVAITYPQAGILFFDVSDPAQPKFLSRYEGSECEGLVLDVDCGAFVDLSADGKAAYLAGQQNTIVPGRLPDSTAPQPTVPGVEIVDISDPRKPRRVFQDTTSEDGGGVHTVRSHVITKEAVPGAEKPGEYLFSIANGVGIEINRVLRDAAGTRSLEEVKTIPIDETHDTFIENDPIARRTYLYIAAGEDTGFYVFDVTNPHRETPLLAEWDLTPQCERDWYSHTIDVTYRGGRRYVTMPAELFALDPTVFGSPSEEDKKEGCGQGRGNGDKAGPMWIVDATDLSKLGPADAQDNDTEEKTTEAALREASQAALVTTWTNAANAAGGNLLLSPHNQQVVGDRIYLSGYHSGVTVLDASAAFQGRNERPKELGFAVPSGRPVRPIYDQMAGPVVPFVSSFVQARPLVWDMFFYRGSLLAADMTGGFYSYADPPAAPAAGPGAPGSRPGDAGPGASSSTDPACTPLSSLRTVGAKPRGRGVRLGFTRSRRVPVDVDVFQESRGRRDIAERLVASFRRRSSSVTWNGKANRRGRRVGDGYYLVRYRAPLPGGGFDVRRVALRRSGGRFFTRPAFDRRESCGLLLSYKLERPVFGGPRNGSIGISYRVASPATVRVTVLRGRRVVRRYAPRFIENEELNRLRFDSERRPRGDYRVQIEVTSGGRRAVATLTARRV
jgi:hypothetical protein